FTNSATPQRYTMNKSRLCQQGSLLVALTSAQGLLAPHALAISSDYIISTQQSDVQIANTYNQVIITDQGSAVSTTGTALGVMQGITVDTLNNNGSITNDGSNFSSQSYALVNEGTIGTLNNAGTISNNNATNHSYYNSAVYNKGVIDTL